MSGGAQNNNDNNSSGGGGGEHLSIKDVYRMLRKEVETASLQAVEADAYQRIAASLGSLKGQGYDGVEAKVRDRMADLLSASARLLIEARQRKIFSGAEPLDYSKLTDEEKYVLDGRREMENRLDEVVAATTRGRPKVLESLAARMRTKRLIVRFVKPMEQFIGVDMAKYGPFQPEDVATLPFENARSFIDGGLAAEVHASL